MSSRDDEAKKKQPAGTFFSQKSIFFHKTDLQKQKNDVILGNMMNEIHHR